MKIIYLNKKIEEVCTNAEKAEIRYGKAMAEKIHLRIDQIKASHDVEMMIKFRVGRCHKLIGDRKNQFAMDLVHPQRLIFEKRGNEIQIAVIIEIADYHK